MAPKRQILIGGKRGTSLSPLRSHDGLLGGLPGQHGRLSEAARNGSQGFQTAFRNMRHLDPNNPQIGPTQFASAERH